jgi:phage terminase small subunit
MKRKVYNNSELIKKITVSGSVSIDQWNDLYSSFVQTLRDNGLQIEVKFTATSNNAISLTENSQIYKSVKESASQLGLNLKEE